LIYRAMGRMGLTKIGILTETADYGVAGRELLRKHAAAQKIQIVMDETYAPDAADLTALFKKAAAAGAEAVVNWSSGTSQATVTKAFAAAGLTALKLFQSPTFADA